MQFSSLSRTISKSSTCKTVATPMFGSLNVTASYRYLEPIRSHCYSYNLQLHLNYKTQVWQWFPLKLQVLLLLIVLLKLENCIQNQFLLYMETTISTRGFIGISPIMKRGKAPTSFNKWYWMICITITKNQETSFFLSMERRNGSSSSGLESHHSCKHKSIHFYSLKL